MKDTDEHLLSLVLDTNLAALAAEGEDVGGIIDSVVLFCNSHLMLNASNQLLLIASHGDDNTILFPDSAAVESGSSGGHQEQSQGHYELFSQGSQVMCQRLRDILLCSSGVASNSDSNGNGSEVRLPSPHPLPSSRGRSASAVAAALAVSLCRVNRARHQCTPGSQLHSRLLVITGHGAAPDQYMDLMNVFFTAQKMRVQLDTCLLSAGQSCILQQGADITGGLCLRVSNVRGLLQYLLWLFLPWADQMKQLTLPAPPLVDYRAACFCHRQLISIGFVCSVCLSIFCKFAPICSTCHTVFKTRPLPALKTNKKRKK